MKKIIEKYGKKKVVITTVIILVVVVGACIGGYYLYQESLPKLIISKDTQTVEYGKETKLELAYFLSKDMDSEDVKNVKMETILTSDKDKYTYDSSQHTVVSKDKEYLAVGTYDINLTLEDEKEKVTLVVKDTTKPTFKDLKKEIKVEQNALKVDFTKFFKAEDLSKVTLSVDSSKVDLKKTGEYTLKVTAKDEYNNETTHDIKVKVVSMKDARKKDGVTKTLDGKVYQSQKLIDTLKAEKEEKAKQEAQNNTPPYNNSSNNSSNSSTSNKPSNPPKEEKPAVCTPTYPEYGDDGKVYLTQQEAIDAGWRATEDPNSPYFVHSFSIIPWYDSCDNIYYLLLFTKMDGTHEGIID